LLKANAIKLYCTNVSVRVRDEQVTPTKGHYLYPAAAWVDRSAERFVHLEKCISIGGGGLCNDPTDLTSAGSIKNYDCTATALRRCGASSRCDIAASCGVGNDWAEVAAACIVVRRYFPVIPKMKKSFNFPKMF
jgi:hypothetical protein